MIQLLIGTGVILGICLIFSLFGVFIIFLNNTFTKNYECYDLENILVYSIKGIGYLLIITSGILLASVIGNAILYIFYH